MTTLLTEDPTPLVENMTEYVTHRVTASFPGIDSQPRMKAILTEFALECFRDGAAWAEQQITPPEQPSPLVDVRGEAL